MMDPNSPQTFQRGDLVRIAKDLGPFMRHFEADVEAIVLGSYAEQYGGADRDSYTVHIRGRGAVSWYMANQLALVKRGRLDLLEAWEAERQAEIALKCDLDWIFAHGTDVLAKPHGASIAALARCFGLTDMWGPRGEGIDLHQNQHATLALAESFLLSGDKSGWLAHAGAIEPRLRASDLIRWPR